MEATKDYYRNSVADGRTLAVKWSLRKYDGRLRTGFIWLRIGTNGGLL
jgi:hypothetical protein